MPGMEGGPSRSEPEGGGLREGFLWLMNHTSVGAFTLCLKVIIK